MRRIYTFLIAALGLSSGAHANCYERLQESNYCKDDVAAESVVNVCADIEELELLTDEHARANEEEKAEIMVRAILIYERLKEMGCANVLRANLICAVCSEGK